MIVYRSISGACTTICFIIICTGWKLFSDAWWIYSFSNVQIYVVFRSFVFSIKVSLFGLSLVSFGLDKSHKGRAHRWIQLPKRKKQQKKKNGIYSKRSNSNQWFSFSTHSQLSTSPSLTINRTMYCWLCIKQSQNLIDWALTRLQWSTKIREMKASGQPLLTIQ